MSARRSKRSAATMRSFRYLTVRNEREIIMDDAHGDAGFTDSRGDSFRRAESNIAGREHTRHAGFDEHRRSVRKTARQIGAGQNKPIPITLDGALEPLGMRHRA